MPGELVSFHVNNSDNNKNEIHGKMYTQWGKFKICICCCPYFYMSVITLGKQSTIARRNIQGCLT